MESNMSLKAGSRFAGKKVLFVSAAVLLLAAGCSKSVSTQTNTQTQATVSGSSQTSLKALMSAGGSKKCDVSFTDSNISSQGTVYLSSGKMHGDFTAQVDGKTQTSHMINDGTYVYTWIDGTTMGMKMSMQDMQQMQGTSTPAMGNHDMKKSDNGIDPSAQHQYNCSDWTADNSEFTPPSTVTFNTMMMGGGEMMHGQNGGTMGSGGHMTPPSSGNSSACSACDNAPASAQAQCKAALGCK